MMSILRSLFFFFFFGLAHGPDIRSRWQGFSQTLMGFNQTLMGFMQTLKGFIQPAMDATAHAGVG